MRQQKRSFSVKIRLVSNIQVTDLLDRSCAVRGTRLTVGCCALDRLVDRSRNVNHTRHRICGS